MAISRESIPAVQRRRQEVPCEPLGGSVVVQSMDIPQLLAFDDAMRVATTPVDGETDKQRERRSMNALMPLVLSMCVLADDDLPVYTEAEWRIWCADHMSAAYELFNAATRGASPEVQKKT